MANSGVKCNVQECKYNERSAACSLSSIEVTHEKTGPDSMSIPHYCKSYEMK